jgi:hypothetical protein
MTVLSQWPSTTRRRTILPYRGRPRDGRRIAVSLWLFQEGIKPEKPTRTSSRDKEADFSGIRCPLCKWQPNRANRWYCADCHYPEYFYDGCGTAWNTFSTRGLCPGCGHQWRWTTCLRCQRWSRHLDWYVRF